MDKKNKIKYVIFTILLVVLGIFYGIGLGFKDGTNRTIQAYNESYGNMENMDHVVLLLQLHCLDVAIKQTRNLEFCDAFVGKDETDENILDLYIFES